MGENKERIDTVKAIADRMAMRMTERDRLQARITEINRLIASDAEWLDRWRERIDSRDLDDKSSRGEPE